MKPGMGKNKGGEFERLICRKLTKWVTGKEDPLIFWRSASSGAHATQKNKAGKESKMYGDIMSIDPAGDFLTNKYVIECKHYKNYCFEDFLVLDKGKVADWWKQVEGDALKADKEPMLIFKRNNYPILIMFNSENPDWYPIIKGNIGLMVFDKYLEEVL